MTKLSKGLAGIQLVSLKDKYNMPTVIVYEELIVYDDAHRLVSRS